MSKSFYILDGHAHIYRAYFAPFRDLQSPTGEPTKATYVFIQRLLSLIEQRKPEYLAMVIDGGDETVFRKEIYPEYKANRKSRPEDFLPQEQRILQTVADMGIPIFVKPGFEADDVIATMARRLCDQGFETFLVSSDKDLRQVVNDCTKMYDAYTDEVIDPARMLEKYGFAPHEAVEIQTLMGDNTDNIPGIPGVGDKTALKLIKQYGTADAVLEHLGELKGKLRENFEKHGDILKVSRQLVTLRTDLEIVFDPEACRFNGINVVGLSKHLRDCGFNSLLERYGIIDELQKPKPAARPALFRETLFDMGTGPETETAAQTSEGLAYTLVNSDEALESILKDLSKQKRFAFDTETDSIDPTRANLVGISVSWAPGTGHYIPVRCPQGETALDCGKVLGKIKPILENPRIRKVGHNIKYDLLVMRKHGIELRGIELDSMVAAFLVDASRMQYGIDSLAMSCLNFRKVATQELIGKGRSQLSMDRVALATITRYAAEDADIALRLAELLEKKLEEVPRLKELNDKVETPLIEVLAEMEHNGVAIDPQILKEQSAVLGERAEELRKRVLQEAGVEFNPDSPKQLADVLFGRLKLPIVKRTKTGPSTDVEVLERLAAKHIVPRLILEYRSLVKLKNTYLDNLTEFASPIDGRIHGSFNQTGASTGRLSMSDPNLQNIPIRTDEGRRIRLAFVPGDPEKNVLVTADYSQIELRLLAHFTREPALLRAFEADEDIHRAVASEVFHVPLEQVTRDQRAQAKTINFGIIYGVSAWGLARRIEGLTEKDARKLIAAYNQRFPSIKTFLEQCVQHAQAHGYVQTILGRRRQIPDINSGVISIRNAGERMAINSVVQGSAADLIKVAMVNVHRRMKRENWKSKLLLQIHDELVFEAPAEVVETESALVRQEMIAAGAELGVQVPLKVDVGWGKNWQEGK